MSLGTPIHLEVNGPRDGRLMVDGVDLVKTLRVREIDFHIGPDDTPVVTLRVVRPFVYDGPAEIRVEPNPEVTIVEFLNSVDPQELEAVSLELCGGLSGPTVAEAMLVALKGLVVSQSTHADA